jgi:hypothetical protein
MYYSWFCSSRWAVATIWRLQGHSPQIWNDGRGSTEVYQLGQLVPAGIWGKGTELTCKARGNALLTTDVMDQPHGICRGFLTQCGERIIMCIHSSNLMETVVSHYYLGIRFQWLGETRKISSRARWCLRWESNLRGLSKYVNRMRERCGNLLGAANRL